MVDMDFVRNAIRLEEQSRAENTERLRAITALENPNSNAQMCLHLSQRDPAAVRAAVTVCGNKS